MPEPLGYQFDRLFALPIERYRQVSTIAERDAIPTGKRWEGMLCYVTSTSTDYQLRTGTTNGDWVEASQGDYFDLTTNDSDDITEGSVNLFLTNTERTKLGYITITGAIDLDQLKTDVDALGGGVTFKGTWSPSGGSFPGGGTAAIGDLYIADDSGTIDSVSFVAGDGIIATATNASTTTFAGNWAKTESTSDVTSVVGLTGVITKSQLLSALNVEDGATADMTGAEIASAITSFLTTSDWQTKLTEEEVLDFVGGAVNAGTQTRGSLTYDDGSDSFDLTIDRVVGETYADLTALIAGQGSQNDYSEYTVTDGSGFTGITSGRVWVLYKGTTVGDETDYIIKSAEQWASGSGGTVTSVAISGTDGIEVDSGSPITTSGTIQLGLNKATTKTFLEDRLNTSLTVTGTFNLDYSAFELWDLTLTGNTTFTESNIERKTILIRCTGDFVITYPTGWEDDITGSYDGTVQNIIVVQYFSSGVYKVQIIQPD